jgi:RNA polymerase sigma factor (sigma-70 family)
MGKAASSPILRVILQVVEDPEVREASDRDLLQRFSERREAAAFHALLRRHGPMVFDVCRGVLGNEANAEDAFQATFLILARKAASIRNTASVGSWLHGVAYRTALKARLHLATRQKYEARAPARPNAEPDDLTWREVRQVLHEELSGLAERYRVPLVACYLEGMTQGEAAAQLGLAKTTLKERLERARSMLRARLVRRGLEPAAVLVATAWPSSTALACLSKTLVSSTIKAASLFAAGQAAAIPVQVTALTEGVLKTMLLTKLRIATAVLVVIALIGAGVIGAATRGPQPVARSPIDGQKGDKAPAAVPIDARRAYTQWPQPRGLFCRLLPQRRDAGDRGQGFHERSSCGRANHLGRGRAKGEAQNPVQGSGDYLEHDPLGRRENAGRGHGCRHRAARCRDRQGETLAQRALGPEHRPVLAGVRAEQQDTGNRRLGKGPHRPALGRAIR